MDAASKTGVYDIREIIDNVKYKPVNSKYKIFIIDEVHMLSKNAFKKIQKCYGHFSSWAVWDPKDISNVDMLDPVNFDLTSSKLKPEIVLVGLNLSAPIGDQPFANFHKYAKGKQAGGSANIIHKLRKSLTSSPAYGGYLTDIIKYKKRLIYKCIFPSCNKSSRR